MAINYGGGALYAQKQQMAATQSTDRALQDYVGNGPVEKNKRGQIETALEDLAANVTATQELVQRIHGTLLGYDPTKNASDKDVAGMSPGILGQHLSSVQTLTDQVIGTRHLLENIASEIGA